MRRGHRRALSTLGLARRAGCAVTGTRAVLVALARHELSLVLVAEDAAENALARMSGLFREEGPPVRRFATRRQLGSALGRGPLVAVGITDDSLAGAVVSALEGSSLEAPGGGDPGAERE